nr:hypothetical protein [Tanacetum cinerariifolium]
MKMTQDAIQVFEHMRVHGLKLHLPTCTVLLSSLVKERLTDTMWKSYKKMVKIGIVPNLHIYNVLIHACCKSLDVVKAEEVMSEMEFKCGSPDLFTYNTLILLYCKKGMHYEALCIQDRMERGGVDSDIITFIDLRQLVNSYDESINKEVTQAREGDTTTGLKIFDEMYKMRLMITQKIHKSFSDSYAGDKERNEGEKGLVEGDGLTVVTGGPVASMATLPFVPIVHVGLLVEARFTNLNLEGDLIKSSITVGSPINFKWQNKDNIVVVKNAQRKGDEASNGVIEPHANNDTVDFGLYVKNDFFNKIGLVDCGPQDQMERKDYEGPT